MKISITYLPEEAKTLSPILRFLQHYLPEVKARESDRHPPFKHIYLTTKKSETPCNSKDKP